MRFEIAPMKTGRETRQGLLWVKAGDAGVAGLTEMDPGAKSLMPLVSSVFGPSHQVFSNGKLGAHSEEIPLIMKRRFNKLVDFKLTPISPNITVGGGVGNDRYLADLRFTRLGRTYTVLHTHLNAEIQNHDPKSPHFGEFFDGTNGGSAGAAERWMATKKAVATIEEAIEAAKKVSDAVVFMGDLNTLEVGQGKTDEHSPLVMLKRQHLEYDIERVTVLATIGLEPVGPAEVTQPGTHGWPSDHASISRKFRRPAKRH